MIAIVCKRSTVIKKMFVSLLCITGSVGLAYAAIILSPDITWTVVCAGLALMGFVFFGRLFIVTLSVLIRNQYELFVYNNEGIYDKQGQLVLWAEIRQFSVVHTRMGILFQPIYAHFAFSLNDGRHVIWQTNNLLTDEELKQWSTTLQAEVDKRSSLNTRNRDAAPIGVS